MWTKSAALALVCGSHFLEKKDAEQIFDAIITSDKSTANYFLKNIKSSIGIHNSSTQFADGGEFGFGAEVGISTNNLPPRGPVGLSQLVSYKYEIYGKGQIRK